MKILQVRFKNLNSLVGEWHIDLTHPAYVSDGLFVITGPTGAGKTTILDAICLALYRRTPRLEGISKKENEIMARNTGECFAEVTIETREGQFRCHWGQHRARKRPGGELQEARHEIADANTGAILETKLGAVADKIEAVTGMDFSRFTRSMLLAQGEFAAFLQAKSDERSPILEQITGTEIYSTISKQVHERCAQEKRQQEVMKAQLEGLSLLNGDVEQELRATLLEMSGREQLFRAAKTQRLQAIGWLEGLRTLEEESRRLEERKQELNARLEAFKPQREMLQRGQKALELAGVFATLNALRGEQQADQRMRQNALLALPEHEAAVQRAETAFRQAEVQLQLRYGAQKAALPLLRQVRELDTKLQEKMVPIDESTKELVRLAEELQARRDRNGADAQLLERQNLALQALLEELTATTADAGLVEQLSGIEGQFKILRERNRTRQGAIKRLAEAVEHEKKVALVCNQQALTLRTTRDALTMAQKAVDLEREAQKTLLAGREIGAWRHDLSQRKERQVALERLLAAVLAHHIAQQELDGSAALHKTYGEEQVRLAQQLQRQAENCTVLEGEAALLEARLFQLKAIQHYEEARQALRDGEECPLCGGKEHPFAHGNLPVQESPATALDQARAALKKANASLSDLKVRQESNRKDLETTERLREDSQKKMAIQVAAVAAGVAALGVAAVEADLEALLPRILEENNALLTAAATVVLTYEEHEQTLPELQTALEVAREAVTRSEQEVLTAGHDKASAAQTVQRVRQELEELTAQLHAVNAECLQLLVPYGITALPLDELDGILRALTERRTQWLTRQKRQMELDKAITGLTLQLKLNTEQLGALEIVLNKQRATLNTMEEERASLLRQRRELFADKNPDAEEKKVAEAIEQAANQQEDHRLALERAVQARDALKQQMVTIETRLATRGVALGTTEAAFQLRLVQTGFQEERDFQAACMSDGERNELAEQGQRLANEQATLETRGKENAALLSSERQKQCTDQSRDQLEQELAKLDEDLSALQQEVGVIGQRLKANDELKSQWQSRAQELEAQQWEYARWERLNGLIGSADGKKFRNFAQGLTFEIMIRHANQQLQKMANRYLLIRDEKQPLELNVVDGYQAGEIRSTKNLSGGESFIVSLALALGLSTMASQRVRVDSLFLDEGFGTLDEEALETALETLASLQQEGKLIGVISHVQALKERIATQIQVLPKTGGRSEIRGPGCGGGAESL